MSVWSPEARNRKSTGPRSFGGAGSGAHRSNRSGTFIPRGIYAVALGVIVLRAGAAGAGRWIPRNRRCCIGDRRCFVFRLVYLVLFLGSLLGGGLHPTRAPIGHSAMRSKETS